MYLLYYKENKCIVGWESSKTATSWKKREWYKIKNVMVYIREVSRIKYECLP